VSCRWPVRSVPWARGQLLGRRRLPPLPPAAADNSCSACLQASMATDAGASNAVVPAAEPEVDLTIHPSGIVPQLQVRSSAACCCIGRQCCTDGRLLLSRHFHATLAWQQSLPTSGW